MKFGLTEEQLHQISGILAQYPTAVEAVLFGSRAMGNFKTGSDVDIALKGDVTSSTAENVKFSLEEDTDLPFFFDVVAYGRIDNEKLRHHIDTHGVTLYRAH